LVYAPFKEPSYENNWLLGVQLAYGQFRTEQSAIILNDLGLDIGCLEIIKVHNNFFKSTARLDKLRCMLQYGSKAFELENALLAASCNLGAFNIEEVTNKTVSDVFTEKSKITENFDNYVLWNILWDRLKNQYGYDSKGTPSVKDFVVYIFESSYKRTILHDTNTHSETLILLKHWKSSPEFKNGLYEKISKFALEQLGFENKLRDESLDILKTFDDYRTIEEEIILKLGKKVESETVSSREISMVVADRKDTYWYPDYKYMYDGLLYARETQELIGSFTFDVNDYEQALKNYSDRWYKIDYSYRKFSYCVQTDIKAKNLLADIQKVIEKMYLNSFLRPLNEAWMPYVEKMADSGWNYKGYLFNQKNFFFEVLQPVIKSDRTAIVIISDALRYEVGFELASEINQTDRYVAKVQPMLANIPSYTQVGMASLLPHGELKVDGSSTTVYSGDQSTAGKEGRRAVLENYSGNSNDVKVFDISEVLNLTTEQLRCHVRDCKIIYVYQNVIDDRGEKDLINACNDAVKQLKDLVVRFGSSNTTLLYITSDHGFLYQQQDLAETDFLADGAVTGKEINKKDRRFIYGKGLNETHGTIIKNLSDIGFANTDNLQVAFPNSILRFRLSGAETHFVHGALSLQELVIPMIEVTKGRSMDISSVGLQMLTDVKSITSGSLVVKFFQTDAVTDKCKGYDASFGIYAEDGTLISNEELKSIDSTAVVGRDREFQVAFTLNKAADSYNGKYVNIIVQQKKAETGRFVDIINQKVRLSRGFELDF